MVKTFLEEKNEKLHYTEDEEGDFNSETHGSWGPHTSVNSEASTV